VLTLVVADRPEQFAKAVTQIIIIIAENAFDFFLWQLMQAIYGMVDADLNILNPLTRTMEQIFKNTNDVMCCINKRQMSLTLINCQ